MRISKTCIGVTKSDEARTPALRVIGCNGNLGGRNASSNNCLLVKHQVQDPIPSTVPLNPHIRDTSPGFPLPHTSTLHISNGFIEYKFTCQCLHLFSRGSFARRIRTFSLARSHHYRYFELEHIVYM